MPSEISVVVKNEEKRQTTNHLIYDDYCVDEDDPVIKKCIEHAIAEFNGEPDKITIKIVMEVT